jgi:hypothetical protein
VARLDFEKSREGRQLFFCLASTRLDPIIIGMLVSSLHATDRLTLGSFAVSSSLIFPRSRSVTSRRNSEFSSWIRSVFRRRRTDLIATKPEVILWHVGCCHCSDFGNVSESSQVDVIATGELNSQDDVPRLGLC